MGLLVTYGALALFFAIVVVILQASYRADRDFSDFTVAGRSFGGFFQAMAFLNTYMPGTVFLGAFAYIVGSGVVGFLISPLVAPIVMFLMAGRVWTWGAKHDLKTQPDLMALRFGSRPIRVVSALVGVLGLFPWMVLGMQSLGAVFHALSLGTLNFTPAVILGVAVMSLRQVWTIRMGMRGIVISDMFQGVVAYLVGTVLMVGVIVWLIGQGASFDAVDAKKLAFPGPESGLPLLFFSLTLLPLLCTLCWPDLFIRLYTGSGVESVKRSSAYLAPILFVLSLALGLLALLASPRADVLAGPETAWFTLAQAAGGVPLLALAGVVVFAASMGNIDATVQSMGAQIANDVIHPYRLLSERGLMLSSQIAMAAITALSAIIACLPLPSLFSIALFAFQVMVQIAVPLYLGIFTRIGTAGGALGGMLAGIAVVVGLQALYPVGIPWAYGLTSGFVGLIVNLAIYLGTAVLLPLSHAERRRVEALFEEADLPVLTVRDEADFRLGKAALSRR